ncbi:unnamed protein product [Cochlearia groenlandica]
MRDSSTLGRFETCKKIHQWALKCFSSTLRIQIHVKDKIYKLNQFMVVPSRAVHRVSTSTSSIRFTKCHGAHTLTFDASQPSNEKVHLHLQMEE